ncbi:MAG TPA: YMGG-like glycine zipper-containing protein [Anaerohalosphaeraceae bacterium]|nr:YMGG-like glycine zipper-containing protein [Anaerohalosphaeraceae bacterium]
MGKTFFSAGFILVTSAMLWLGAGCASDAQTDALIGGAVGAGVGQAIGRDTKGTLIGAAVGAGAGYAIGAQSDKKKNEKPNRQETTVQPASASSSETIWITNSNGSKTSVVIRKEGNFWYGPKGERYDTKPTEEQLRAVYGF